jgi:hypothetical protein
MQRSRIGAVGTNHLPSPLIETLMTKLGSAKLRYNFNASDHGFSSSAPPAPPERNRSVLV